MWPPGKHPLPLKTTTPKQKVPRTSRNASLPPQLGNLQFDYGDNLLNVYSALHPKMNNLRVVNITPPPPPILCWITYPPPPHYQQIRRILTEVGGGNVWVGTGRIM